MSQDTEWVHSALRNQREKAREASRDLLMQRRRFSEDDQDLLSNSSSNLCDLLRSLRTRQFRDRPLLLALKQCLASDESCPDDLFAVDGALSGLVTGLNLADLQLPTTQVLANLAPLSEKNGLSLARSAGPYLVTLLASGSAPVREASCVALGNLALAGARVVRVLVNQEAVTSLVATLQSPFESVQAAGYYALYHILHTSTSIETPLLQSLAEQCKTHMSVKCPLELHWVYFVLSCNHSLHSILSSSSMVNRALDICTYEIFQKSDSRPLVKIVTPIIRYLANLCAGPESESTCLFVLRYPDLQAILMALLGTNYTHLCKETLWLFSNIVNSESVVVQEELVELDFMDRLEFHTGQAIQKMDPYLTNVIN